MSVPYFRPPVAPLFVPGNRPERFAKAEQSDADAIIIDLEDAVQSDEKGVAQQNILAHGISSKPVFVRINSPKSHWCPSDIATLTKCKTDGVMVPKAETTQDIAEVHDAIGQAIPIIALVESVAVSQNLPSLLRAPHLLCAAFGSLDYALDLGCASTWEPLAFPRSALVLESRLAGLPAPIDGVTPQLADDVLLRTETLRAKSFGYAGKLAIHPRQTSIIHDALRPTKEELEWASSIVIASEGSTGAVKFKGEMIDQPVIERAKQILLANR